MLDKRFGKLTIIEKLGKRSTRGEIWWLYLCDCGEKRPAKGTRLRNGQTTRCPKCWLKEKKWGGFFRIDSPQKRVHGIWNQMQRRCNDKRSHGWKIYGGRGIKVCERWKSAISFYEDMGLPPSKQHTLDRINSDGDYTPENCRWADRETQHNNTRRNIFIEYDGKKQTLSQWARELNVNKGRLYSRMKINTSPIFVLFGKKRAVLMAAQVEMAGRTQ